MLSLDSLAVRNKELALIVIMKWAMRTQYFTHSKLFSLSKAEKKVEFKNIKLKGELFLSTLRVKSTMCHTRLPHWTALSCF